jgi:hypothetical protein
MQPKINRYEHASVFVQGGEASSRQKTAITFSVHMDNSMCDNDHRVVDELRRLKILRTVHPLYSPEISPCDF